MNTTETPQTIHSDASTNTMYASKTFAASLLFSLALAADHVPVTIENLDSSFDVKCGTTTVSGQDIYNSVAWGMSLNENDQTFTGTNGKTTRQSVYFHANDKTGEQYPSYYGNSDGFKWISSECNNQPSDAVQHMPVLKGGYFGESSTDPGKFRSVYWYNYDTDNEGHPKGWYCGTIYHASSDNSFSGCDVRT